MEIRNQHDIQQQRKRLNCYVGMGPHWSHALQAGLPAGFQNSSSPKSRRIANQSSQYSFCFEPLHSQPSSTCPNSTLDSGSMSNQKTSRAQITDCQKHTLTDKQLPAYLFLPLDVRHLVSCLESGGSMANKKLIRRQLNVHVRRLNVANLTAQNSRLKIFRNTIQWLKDLKHQWIILSRHKKQFVCLIFGVWRSPLCLMTCFSCPWRTASCPRTCPEFWLPLDMSEARLWCPLVPQSKRVVARHHSHASLRALAKELWVQAPGWTSHSMFFFAKKKSLTWPGVCLINR